MRICIFVVAYDIVLGLEHICVYNFYMIRIIAAGVS